MQVFQKAKFLGDLTIIKMKNKSDKSISSLLIDCQIVTSAKKISNYFNTFFTSVAVQTNKNIVKSKKTHLSSTLAMKTVTQFSFLQLHQKILKT